MAANYSDDDDDDGEMQELTTPMRGLEIDGMESKRRHLSPLQKQDILLNHIILPHFLPATTSPRFHKTELKLFDEMFNTVMDLSHSIPKETVALFKSMHKIHHKLTPANVSREINALQPGDTFAMFVRRQNCAFIVHVPAGDAVVNGKPQNAIVATFPGRLHPNEVYKAESDIEFTYPQQAINVKFSHMLRSEDFAHQLCFMYHSLPIESKRRDYVSKWLVATLCDEQSQTAHDFPTITKKVRDELLGDSTKNYFRRSSFYTVIKVLLQHSLTVQKGNVFGEVMYKCIMLKFMVRICGFYKNHTTFDIDLLSQMIAKMARRIEHLKYLFDDSTDPCLVELFDATVQEAIDSIADIRMAIDAQVNEKIALNVELPPLNGLDFTRDITQNMSKLSQFVRAKEAAPPSRIVKNYEVKSYERLAVNNDELGGRVHWMGFEKSILNGKIDDTDDWSPHELYLFSNAYSRYAEEVYAGNQLFVSRMILVRLKIICLLDQYACRKYPLLLEHHSGCNPTIIASLLLPQRIDMKMANRLEQYFLERNKNSRHPSLIGEHQPTDRSFSAKFAKADANMQRIHGKIMERDRINLVAKEKEVMSARSRVDKLRREAAKRSCEFKPNFYGIASHSDSCNKCHLERQANGMQVVQYENLLPNYYYKHMAIIFELCIPEMIAYLRDTLFSFTKYCSNELCLLIDVKFAWTANHPDIKCHNQSNQNYAVKLGNTIKFNLQSIDVCNALEYFKVENIKNCIFYYVDASKEPPRKGKKFSERTLEIPTSIADDAIKELCTFQAQNEYACLQWTLRSTNHTQNQVLAQQSNCPNELTLSEFKNFGSLRADGHRLQFRHLYAMIETEALSFESESVLMLIMQCLWECGIKGDVAGNIRESHVDFSGIFCHAFIQLLQKFVGQQKCNWKHPFKMIMAVLIAVRAFEINSEASVADEIVKLLNNVRSIVVNWMDEISNTIQKMENPDEMVERELRLKLIYAGIAGALTFYIHPEHEHFKRIFDGNPMGNVTAANLWLQYIITVKSNTLIYTSDESSLSPILRMFLRLIESIGVHLEDSIRAMIKVNPRPTTNLIQKLWTRADGASFHSLEFHSGKYPQIFVAKAALAHEIRTVTIDIITGIFLVDGYPVGRLPTEIIKNDAYQGFFGNATFQVQPDAPDNYSTVQRYNGCTYEIRKNDEKSITIIERQADGVEKELIDHSMFSGGFPHLLVTDYSHWWDKTTNRIEFRRRAFNQKHFSKETTVDYVLDLSAKRLCHVKTERWMLDVGSNSYKNIVRQLVRFEHSNYIHILVDKGTPKVAVIELVRMNLKFEVDASKGDESHHELVSNEFSGMQVSRQQNVGTLYGLKHGLILESKHDTQNRILLIPHGDIQCKRTECHVEAQIDTENELRHPPFFQYKIDEFCRQIKSNNRDYASWFYLAYLHACTSHGQIERFTGMSGTERALQILQSAYVWSSEPYEAEAIKMLEEIAELAPRRQMDENRQTVVWPDHVHPHAARDCFIFIARKLFADSQRLHGLHFKEKADDFKEIETDLGLNLRDHRRCQQLNPNLCVSDQFIEPKRLTTTPSEQHFDSFSGNTRAVTALYHCQQHIVRPFLNLKMLLLNEEQLIGLADEDELNILDHAVHVNFANLWIRLYDAARKRHFNPEQFALILSVYAHRGVNIDVILALQTVATHPAKFEQVDPPLVSYYEPTLGMHVVNEWIYQAIIRCYTQPADYYTTKWMTGQHIQHDLQLQHIIGEIIAMIHAEWPCDSVNLNRRWQFSDINFLEAEHLVNYLLRTWNNNRQLFMFIEQVEEQLRSLLPKSRQDLIVPEFDALDQLPVQWSKFDIDFDHAIHENLNRFTKICNDAKQIWLNNQPPKQAKSSTDWWSEIQSIFNVYSTKHLIDAGLFPRTVPSRFLPKLLDADIDERLKCVIGVWAIAIAREQREKRIESSSERPELQAAMQQEIENEPYANWMACERPEWLLFEIEQNLTIRRIQVEVANRMIKPPKKEGAYAKHSVMQLNMGEGKTAVIVPILAAVLTDGTQTCQITVLKSLYATNLNALRQYLGGLLNRRIYTFPCRRDMPIGQHIPQLLDIYEECMMNKGVILTLPEYRLSFQLKLYEAIQKTDIEMARGILEVLKWSNQNVRNILDESDAILQPKYQLIYTVGNQMPPDGGELRWTIAQAVLKRVPGHMRQLYEEHGKDKIEFDDTDAENAMNKFARCRLLHESMFAMLKAALIKDFLDGQLDIEFPGIVSTKKDALRKVLSNKIVDKALFEVVNSFPLNEQNTIWILSGLLRFEVLKLCLTKRWRVNYGVDVNGRRKMAVPFRAKDVPAAEGMTEFGHPDVAICLTQLSYYYSGLSNAELMKVFKMLENNQNGKIIYEQWIRKIPPKFIDRTIRTYDGINLDDIKQRERTLFPLLRFHMHVIDFYLSNVVFRHEMKIFESKLTCTAWDLCSDRFERLVTGFSGTNDTKDILPLPIAQNDLPELENTNEAVRKILMQPENQAYVGLPANVSGMEIIERLIQHEIPVLLDAGALMLELNNKQVAEGWLKLTSFERFDAAVYFDSRDVLQTIDRNGTVTAFDCSGYRESLNRCLVYLDDAHTRGTDLKFPVDWKAAVTLCGDITRDKTVQSCMRMRQLGKTHSIAFWASFEADVRIRELCKLAAADQVSNQNVIEFICHNSRRFEQTNMSHWTAAALNYTKKLTAHKLFEARCDGTTALDDLYSMCVDRDFGQLSQMYGEKDELLLTEIAKAQFARLAVDPQISDAVVDKIQSNVNDKLIRKVPKLKQFVHALDEEQEKELEHELEEQRLIERPSAAVPYKPQFDERLSELVKKGVVADIVERMKNTCALLTIGETISRSRLYRLSKNDSAAWDQHILVTKDFQAVVDGNNFPSCSGFLRPVWWIAQIKNANGNDLLILLSSYECNELLPEFRTSKMATLLMYRPRLSKFHCNLLHEHALQITAMDDPASVHISDEVQIGVYSGSMYFANEAEQNAYCEFLGLIPRPRTRKLQHAFEQQIIEANGFVRMKNRLHSTAIRDRVGKCKFHKSPVDLAIKLIEAHHHSVAKFSHVASILIRGMKSTESWKSEPSSSDEYENFKQIQIEEELEKQHGTQSLEHMKERFEVDVEKQEPIVPAEESFEVLTAKEEVEDQSNKAEAKSSADSSSCQIQ